jgi:hypothetical protein
LANSSTSPTLPTRTIFEGISVPESPSHAVGLELSLLPVVESCLGESFVERSADEGFASGVEPTPLAVIPAKEPGFPPFVVAPTSEDFITIDAGDGSSQTLAFGFSVPFAEEFFGFLPAGSLSKDWEGFYSSQGRSSVGMSGFRSSLGGGSAGEPIMQG